MESLDDEVGMTCDMCGETKNADRSFNLTWGGGYHVGRLRMYRGTLLKGSLK